MYIPTGIKVVDLVCTVTARGKLSLLEEERWPFTPVDK